MCRRAKSGRRFWCEVVPVVPGEYRYRIDIRAFVLIYDHLSLSPQLLQVGAVALRSEISSTYPTGRLAEPPVTPHTLPASWRARPMLAGARRQ